MFLAVSITIFKRNHFNRQGLVSGTEAKSCFLFSYTEELSYLLPFPASKFTIILRSCLNASDVFFFFQKAYGVWDGLTPNNGARPNFDRLFPNLTYLAQKLQIYIYMYTYTRISILSMFKSLFKSKLFFIPSHSLPLSVHNSSSPLTLTFLVLSLELQNLHRCHTTHAMTWLLEPVPVTVLRHTCQTRPEHLSSNHQGHISQLVTD